MIAAAAAAAAVLLACPRVPPSHVGGTQGYRDSLGSGECYVSIGPMSSEHLVYRQFGFYDGLLMVFSSYGDGVDGRSNQTSAREFWFFPRRAAPELRMDPAAGTVSVLMADGGVATFDAATAQLSGLDRGSVSVSPRLDPAERGGVEVSSYAGLVMDGGFRIGESPTMKPEWSSTFRDAQGHLCAVKNREVFSYAGGDRAFKFDDASLSAFLRTRCPNLTPGF